MKRTTRKLAGLAAVLVLAAGPAPAWAVDQSKGHPGFCTDGTGVTVVVDFQQLGGTTVVRCNPQGTRGTGLDALKGAGFQIAGVQRWGEAFICRVENRPSAVEKLPVTGKEGYREACVDTPPAAAYWSYWHAGNNCPWAYSQWGVKNRDFAPGGFEGWSFSLNATADSNPKPRIAAVRPGTAGEACTTPDEPAPTSNDPNERQQPQPLPGPNPGTGSPTPGKPSGGAGPGGAAGPGTGGGTSPGTSTQPGGGDPATGGGTGALPPPKPRPSAVADDPARNVAFTGGESLGDVNKEIKDQSGASDYAPWVAGGAVVILIAATWLTARRRKRTRES
ncbi:ABC transporter substrate-binding protein [Actinocrispum wychmicini]|uniref:ABC transporter substrate-binding protein n=1 Tax=Actinocrispum wychmicini TaxID=1213861 RepID=A0A4R2JC29_9PSEU|nr:ABC transporter substrate-binding protein [Actinocrispum wychmicini]TCO54288.1 hypothetical protein EV192_109269 [Actinocrispum wychmicini]